MLDPSYDIQSSCMNCKLVEIIKEYDEGSTYYCNHDKSQRPQSGSVQMREMFPWDDDDRANKLIKEWDAWSEGREVESNGKCDKYE